jgi:hypothetical protein
MDNNAALRRLYGQFHVHAVDMPSPAEAVTILDQYKETMRALGIKVRSTFWLVALFTDQLAVTEVQGSSLRPDPPTLFDHCPPRN